MSLSDKKETFSEYKADDWTGEKHELDVKGLRFNDVRESLKRIIKRIDTDDEHPTIIIKEEVGKELIE